MVLYKIVTEKRLIIEYFIGRIILDEMLQFVEKVKNDKDYDKTFNSLIDLSEAEMSGPTKDIRKYVNYLKTNSRLLDQRKLAMITKTPDQVVTVTLYKLLGKDLPLNIRIFSTFEAAARWLGLFRFTFDDYAKIVKNLKG